MVGTYFLRFRIPWGKTLQGILNLACQLLRHDTACLHPFISSVCFVYHVFLHECAFCMCARTVKRAYVWIICVDQRLTFSLPNILRQFLWWNSGLTDFLSLSSQLAPGIHFFICFRMWLETGHHAQQAFTWFLGSKILDPTLSFQRLYLLKHLHSPSSGFLYFRTLIPIFFLIYVNLFQKFKSVRHRVSNLSWISGWHLT